MPMKITRFGALLCASVFSAGLAAAQQSAPAEKGKPMMMAQHEEVSKLVERLQNSFAILENEKDPALLKKELAEHGALLKGLEAKTGSAKKEMCCKGMKGAEKATAAAEEAAPDPHAGHQH
jgi:hypothetical protein